MAQGYKTSNRTRIGKKTDGNGYTILKGSVLFSYSGKKRECEILSCKNDRHPYDKRNEDTATKLNLPELEKSDRENYAECTGYTICVIFMICAVNMNGYYNSPAAEPRTTGRCNFHCPA